MKQSAVTIIEILIVVIIIAILSAIAVPVYTNKIERTRGERAIANIELIVSAMKMYYIKYPAGPAYPIAPLPNINTTFNLDLSDSFFNYNIDTQGDHRIIEAVRNSGPYNPGNSRIEYDIDPVDGDPDDWEAAPANAWPWHP